MAEKCFYCGKFVPIGKDITGLVIRTDGREQYYCDKCLKMGEILKDGSVGNVLSYLKEQDYVKEFKLV